MNTTEKIYLELKSSLEQGKFTPGSRFPSEADLADEFGVSKITMNKIVSMLADGGYLKRGIRGAGTRVMAQLFRPRGYLAFLGRFNAFGDAVFNGIQRECLHNGYFPIVFSPAADELHQCLQMFHRQTVGGIITMGYGVVSPPDGMELVCIDHTQPLNTHVEHVHFVNSDNYTGGRMMMEEILRRGHRRIIVFSSERFVLNKNAAVTPRVRGFHDIMKANGLQDADQRTFYGAPNSLADAKACLKRIQEQYSDTSIICTDSDGSAELINRAGRELGIECPGKIALTGFGNVTHLPIANVNQNPERQGELAARYLISFPENGSPTVPVNELVETSLVGVEYIPIILG